VDLIILNFPKFLKTTIVSEQSMNKKLFGFTSLLLAGITFGSFGVWIRLLSKELTIYQQIVFRNVIAMVFAIGIIVTGKRLITGFAKVKKSNLFLYGLAVPLSVVFYNVAILNIKIAVTTFVFYIGSILFSWIFSVFFFNEKITILKVSSLVSVLIGLVFFIWPLSLSSLNIGFVAAIISGLLDAVANGFRKDLAGKIDKFILVFITTLGGVVVSGLMMFYFKQNFNFISSLSVNTWAVGLMFGFILVAVNYLLLVGFQNFDLSLGAIILSSELIFALLIGLLIFGEKPLPKEIIGGLFVMAAVILPNLNLLSLKSKKL